ncbi:MAG: 2-hydroxychromene-2-carboxylate isomerase [Gammaproteobacteria bacterium]|nr:2-hydroxychromene-2-carboxylate isomerase [Gammaproteobacteria bacterium]
MANRIDYYHFLISPWSYLAIERFNVIRDTKGVAVNYKPIDVMSTFDKMGGLPPAKRHPSRQNWRMEELKRWQKHLNVPMNLTPAFFPADQALAAKMVYAAGGAEAILEAGMLSDAVLRACWAEEKNIADEATLVSIADGCGLDGQGLLAKAQTEDCARDYLNCTEEAHMRDVFGSPTYIVGEELFWGQDRLDFLAAAL